MPAGVSELLNSKEGLKWKRVHYGRARLESTRRTSIVLAAFTFAVFSSLQLNFPTECPSYITTMLSVNSALLISMHSFAFIISTSLLPKLQAVTEEYKCPSDSDASMPPVPKFSPHDRFQGILELSYNISHLLGLFLFLLQIPLITWVKFWDVSIHACIGSTVAAIPFLIAFVWFCWRYQNVLNSHLYDTRATIIDSVEKSYKSEESLLTSSQSSVFNFNYSSSRSLNINIASD